MKRLMLWEVAVLAVLLIATFVVLVTFPSPDLKAEISGDPTATTGPQPTEPGTPTPMTGS